MPRQRSPLRDKAEELYINSKGTIKLIDIASQLNLKDSQIRKWKSQDKWDDKLKGISKERIKGNVKLEKSINNYKERNKIIPKKENETLYFRMIRSMNDILNDNNVTAKEKIEACKIILRLTESPGIGKKINKLSRNIDLRDKESITEEEWDRTKAYFNYSCAYCGKKTDNLEKEHIIPFSKGGSAKIYNIIPSCKHCNVLKNDKELIDWYLGSGIYNEDRLNKIFDYIEESGGYNITRITKKVDKL